MDEVFLLWNMNADSMSGARNLISIHKTVEGARKAAAKDFFRMSPEGLERHKREPFGDYVENYTYVAIEKYQLAE